MPVVNAENLPWVLIGGLFSALVAVFYAMLRGKILAAHVAEQLRHSAEKRAEIAESGVAANTKSVESLASSMAKLLVLAENQDRVLKALRERVERDHNQRRGGSS
jgi:uncharacterized sporulation protein YeaH/YhbH (DUF444 family)